MTGQVATDRPILGITLMLGFCVFAPLGDGLAKALTASIPVMVLVTVRFAMQPVILLPVVLATGGSLRMGRRAFRLTLVRTALHIAGLFAMFLALKYLPLADAVAIAFVMPFIMLLLGHMFLSEAVGRHRIAACTVGFAGTLMVIQPAFAEVGAAALLPLAVAVIFAVFMLITRLIAREVGAIELQVVSGLLASSVLLPFVAVLVHLGWVDLSSAWSKDVMPWLMLGALGIVGTLAHLLMTWSLRFAPATTLAPMQYLEIPFATLLGWLMFRDFPNGLALVGIAVVIGAGLYVIWRERRAEVQTEATPAPPAAE